MTSGCPGCSRAMCMGSAVDGMARRVEHELIEGQIEPAAELEADLFEGPGMAEAEPLMQRDAAAVGGIDAAHHHVHLPLPRLGDQRMHQRAAEAVAAMVLVHVDRM